MRKEAIRLTVEENFSIQADQQHKLTHWVQLLTIANAQQACSIDEVQNIAKKLLTWSRRGHVLGATAAARGFYRHVHNQLSQHVLHQKEVGKKEILAKVIKAHKVRKKILLQVLLSRLVSLLPILDRSTRLC